MCPRSKAQFEVIRRRSRDAILRAAVRLFAQKGFSGTTTADIAEAVGISKGLIYNYFPSKDAIFMALIDEFIQRIVPSLPWGSSGQSPTEYLEVLIRGWFREIRTNPALIKLGVQFHTDTALKKLIRRKQAEMEEKYTAFFQDVFRRLGTEDPEVETLLLGAILDGVGVNYAVAPGKFPLDRVEEHLVNSYCRPRRRKR